MNCKWVYILIIFIRHIPVVQTGGIWGFLKQVIDISGVLFPCHTLVVFLFHFWETDKHVVPLLFLQVEPLWEVNIYLSASKT